MKRTLFVFATIIIASASIGVAADAAAIWAQNCASCHGKDGSGNTMMGKKLGVKDYTKESQTLQRCRSGKSIIKERRKNERQGNDEAV